MLLTQLVCPGCGGNLDFCVHKNNCFITEAYNSVEFVKMARISIDLTVDQSLTIFKEAKKTPSFYNIERERKAFFVYYITCKFCGNRLISGSIIG